MQGIRRILALYRVGFKRDKLGVQILNLTGEHMFTFGDAYGIM